MPRKAQPKTKKPKDFQAKIDTAVAYRAETDAKKKALELKYRKVMSEAIAGILNKTRDYEEINTRLKHEHDEMLLLEKHTPIDAKDFSAMIGLKISDARRLEVHENYCQLMTDEMNCITQWMTLQEAARAKN